MRVADKITALFAALTREEIDAMPPAVRRAFADLCRHWADCAEVRSAQARDAATPGQLRGPVDLTAGACFPGNRRGADFAAQ